MSGGIKTRKNQWTETMLDALIAGVGDHEGIINAESNKEIRAEREEKI